MPETYLTRPQHGQGTFYNFQESCEKRGVSKFAFQKILQAAFSTRNASGTCVERGGTAFLTTLTHSSEKQLFAFRRFSHFMTIFTTRNAGEMW